MQNERWDRVAKAYRMVLMERGVETVDDEGKTVKRGIKKEKLYEERERGYELAKSGLLMRRLAYFTEGAVLGSQSFVERIYGKNRRRMGAKRKQGARVPKNESLGGVGLCVLTNVRAVG